MSEQQPQLYTELADWYPLLTAPEDYPEEAAFYLHLVTDALGAAPCTLLELGSGAGHMASHYKHHVPHVTLTDLSPQMLALSQHLNPDCEHLLGAVTDYADGPMVMPAKFRALAIFAATLLSSPPTVKDEPM